MYKQQYFGAEGLERLQAHMRVSCAERRQGGQDAWGQEYFLGWLHGLNSAGAISADINTAAYAFVADRQYELS